MKILPSRSKNWGVFNIFRESSRGRSAIVFPSNRLEEGKERFLLETDANKKYFGHCPQLYSGCHFENSNKMFLRFGDTERYF